MQMTYEEFSAAAAPVRDALLAIGKAADASGLEKTLTELVKLRVSQINGCAFCLQLHLNIARRLGIAGEKLDLVRAWRETALFTAREMAALAWAEALTTLDDREARTAASAELDAHFTQHEIVHLTATVGAINQWNRIAIGLHFHPPARA